MFTRLLSIVTTLGALIAGSAIVATGATRAHATRGSRPPLALADSLEQTLEAAERQSWIAWQHHDGKFFASFLSDDHVEVGTTGLATKAQVVAFVASGACRVKSYSVDHFHATRFDENTALLTYRAEQDTMCGKTAVPSPARVSSLFVRRSGKWVNALYQHTKAE